MEVAEKLNREVGPSNPINVKHPISPEILCINGNLLDLSEHALQIEVGRPGTPISMKWKNLGYIYQ